MGDKGDKRTTFGNKDALFPGIKREDHRNVLWREHVSKELLYKPGIRPFAIVDTKSLGRTLVDGKPPMATRPVPKAQSDAAAWGRASARSGTWGRGSARNRLSMHLGQRAEPLLESLSMPELQNAGGVESLPEDFTFDIDLNESFSHRNALPARSKNRGMSVGGSSVGGSSSRYSEHSWGPILMNGNVPRTESQNFGWHREANLVRQRHATKRQRERAAKVNCEEVAYADNFFSSFGVGLYAPRGSVAKNPDS